MPDSCPATGCSSSKTQTINYVNYPDSYAYSANGLTVNFTDSTTFSTSWHWNFGDGTTDTLKSPIHIYNTPGIYLVCLVSYAPCGTDTLCDTVTITLTGVSKNSKTISAVQVYPNPATDQLNISIDETLLGAQLNIYDVAGALVLQSKIQNLKSKIDCSAYPSGVYIAEIKTGNAVARRRWVKM